MAAQVNPTFTDLDDKKWLMYEAKNNYAIMAYKSDRRKAVTSDPRKCILALGAKRDKDVIYAEIGSGGDCYIGFRDKLTGEEYINHYITSAKAQHIVDTFDQKGSPQTQIVWLLAPSASKTFDYRRKKERDRKRAERAAAAAKATEPEGTKHVEFEARTGGEKRKRRSRLELKGVTQRPRPKITHGSWSLGDETSG